MPSLVLTLIGPDRPGLVESVAKLVRQQEGNWLESRMAHLAGQFAGIVRVEVAAGRADDLIAALQNLAAEGLDVVVRRDDGDATAAEVQLIHLDLVGNDRPGIVNEVTAVLAAQQVNVEEFQTECVEAPTMGSRLFRAKAELRLPSGLTVEALQTALENVSVDLMVDIRLGKPSE